MQKATAEYRSSKWAKIIQAQLSSGQNIKNFCEARGISRHAFFYWQKKLRIAACTELSKTTDSSSMVPSGWMQLGLNHEHLTKEILDVEINGCHISVGAETDPELLKKVCRILRSV